MKEIDFSKLKFMRVFTPEHIPTELVEQIKERRFTVEEFYKHLTRQCLANGKNGITLNENCHLYVICNEKKQVVGFVWFEINPLTNVIYLQNFSMKQDYWFKGKAVNFLANFMKEQLKKLGCDAILWHTKCPKQGIRNGFKQSRQILMEYVEK